MERRNVIIDCDPGIDDSLALMLALKSPEINLLGITIVCGNSPVEMGFANAKKVLTHMDRLDVPVYVGEAKPLRREYVNALDTHGADGLGESFLPEVACEIPAESAVDFMRRVLQESAGQELASAENDGLSGNEGLSGSEGFSGKRCDIIALGPMTNLARLIEQDPQAFEAIGEIVSMGGCYKSHGNCSPVAEYNYWCDPDAAALVYETAQKCHKLIHMVGLDVTREIVLTPDLLTYMKRLSPQQGDFIEKITKFYFDFHWEWEHLIGCVINDPLAVAYYLDRSLCHGFSSYTAVETEGISLGQTLVDAWEFYKKEHNSVVLTETDPLAFFTFFFSRILEMDAEKLDLLPALVRR